MYKLKGELIWHSDITDTHQRFIWDKSTVLRAGKKGINLFKLSEQAGHNTWKVSTWVSRATEKIADEPHKPLDTVSWRKLLVKDLQTTNFNKDVPMVPFRKSSMIHVDQLVRAVLMHTLSLWTAFTYFPNIHIREVWERIFHMQKNERWPLPSLHLQRSSSLL